MADQLEHPRCMQRDENFDGECSFLIPMPGGPTLPKIQLRPGSGAVIVGRQRDCSVVLPNSACTVSRYHAAFTYRFGLWRVADMKSRTGTYLNGVPLVPGSDMPLRDRDLIRIAPWTFYFRYKAPAVSGTRSVNDDQAGSTLVRRNLKDFQWSAHDLSLSLLLAGAVAMHAAEDERSLAEALVKLVCDGTGMLNAVVLRAANDLKHVEIVAAHPKPASAEPNPARFSRTVLHAAAQGNLVELHARPYSSSNSIQELQIVSAICVPILLGETIAGFLYTDRRAGDSAHRDLACGGSPADFCHAAATIASLALGNLKRTGIDSRIARIQAEMDAAGVTQRWLTPKTPKTFGPFRCIGATCSGAAAGGDFFDIIPLHDGRVAVVVGDVSGHGVHAAVLAAAVQGFLHARLSEQADPALAVTGLNCFVAPRTAPGKFVTVWVGVLDPASMTLTYVDAGHGYGMLIRDESRFSFASDNRGIPIGVDRDEAYVAVELKLNSDEALLVVTDGLIEQRSPGRSRMFGLEGIESTIRSKPQELIHSLLTDLQQFAGSCHLTDDVTVLLVNWQ
jgi:phosphoserine phosphatase RsbU/P